MNLIQSDQKIDFVDFGGEGPLLHFAHANGYPPEVYQKFLAPFTKHFRVIGLYQRPLWEGTVPEKTKSWKVFADDFIQFLEENQFKKVVAMGHSLGGVVSLLAADKRPDLFEKLVFIDPVFFTGMWMNWTSYFPASTMKKIVPPAKIALKRKDHWESPQVMFDSFRKKKVFRYISDDVLWDTVNFGTKAAENGGITLRFSKAWEAQVYALPPRIWGPLKRLNIPSMGIKAQFSDVIMPNAWERWQKTRPEAHFLEFEKTGHLLPFEQPESLSKAILEDFLLTND